MGRTLRTIGAALVTGAALVVIVALATDRVTLVTTYGQSMAPRFNSGDLAVIVPDPTYHVGQIVGYQSPLLHVVVLHRIVAVHDGRFTFQGDNNSFLDPLRLPASAVKGRLWLHVPYGGTVLGEVRSPVALGVMALIVTGLCLGGASRRRRTMGPTTGRTSPRTVPKHAAPKPAGVDWWPVAVPSAVAGVLVVATVVAWAMPATRASVRPVPYTQHLTITYAATAPPGATYPSGSVSTGAPVFLRLVRTLDVTAHYELDMQGHPVAPARAAVTGTLSASAVLRGPDGWSRQFAALAPVSFSGPRASVVFPVDLSRIAALKQAFVAETGVPLAGAQVAILPMVHLHGRLAGSPVNATFAPPITFVVNGEALDLAATTPTPSSASTGTTPPTPALSPNQSGAVDVAARVPVRLTLLGRSMDLATARWVGLGAVVVALVAAAVGWVWRSRRRRMDDAGRIRAAHAHDLVPVSSSPAVGARLVVEVATFDALVRLARRYDCVLLVLEHAGGHAYFVECGATIYRHGPDPAAGLTVVEPRRTTSTVGNAEVPPTPSDTTFYVRSAYPAT
jgi:signal peptidase I